MTEQAELLRTRRQLQELRRTRPEVYDLIKDAAALPADKYAEFMRQAMPIIKKYMN